MDFVLGYEGWEEGFDVFVPNYYTADLVDIAKVELEIRTTCSFMQDVGEVGFSGYTYTSDFNNLIFENGYVHKQYYSLMGDGEITTRECEAVDCLHPCYGDIYHYGACAKCIDYLISSEGDRHSVCDYCGLKVNAVWSEYMRLL